MDLGALTEEQRARWLEQANSAFASIKDSSNPVEQDALCADYIVELNKINYSGSNAKNEMKRIKEKYRNAGLLVDNVNLTLTEGEEA